MTADSLSHLQVWILDEAYDFPVPIWHLVQPTTVVFNDAAPGEPDSVRHEGHQPAEVRAALVDLLDQGLLQMLYEQLAEPERPVAPADWHRLLDDPATWQHPSSTSVSCTPAGERVIDAVFADDSSTDIPGPHAP